jgi:hypothetical protein
MAARVLVCAPTESGLAPRHSAWDKTCENPPVPWAGTSPEAVHEGLFWTTRGWLLRNSVLTC